MIQLVLTCFAAILAGMFATSFMKWLAPRIGLVDQPDGHRKLHKHATALGGGAAVFVASACSSAAYFWWLGFWQEIARSKQMMLVGLVIASGFIVLVGLLDDRYGIRGRQKLAAQFVAAGIMLYFGVTIQTIQIFDWTIELGALSAFFTIFWLLGAINAINLLDGIDGLAATLGSILSLGIAAMAATMGRFEIAVVALLFAGSLLGFLRYNFPPASIFLGDAGSMLIGLVVGVLAIESSLKGAGTVLLAAPLAIWAIPILDSSAAIMRRKLTGRSIYTTDRGHLHHRLMDRWGCNRKTLAFVALCCLATCFAGFISIVWNNDFIALLTCVALLGMLVTTRIFGHTEFALASNRALSVVTSLVTPFSKNSATSHQSSVRLQGSRKWEILWETLVVWAEKMDVSEIRLDLNLPLVHEGYYASWKHSTKRDFERAWRFTLPLVADGNTIGSLLVVAERNGLSAKTDIEGLMCLLEPFELELAELVANSTLPRTDTSVEQSNTEPEQDSGRQVQTRGALST